MLHVPSRFLLPHWRLHSSALSGWVLLQRRVFQLLHLSGWIFVLKSIGGPSGLLEWDLHFSRDD